MTEAQAEALKEFIRALIAERIEHAFGRDALHESVALREAERRLDETLSG